MTHQAIRKIVLLTAIEQEFTCLFGRLRLDELLFKWASRVTLMTKQS
jgi:hypothetical protein